MSKSKHGGNETQFSCHAPDAKQVFLASTFNDWQADETPMDKGDDGKWTTKLAHSTGRCEFKCVVDSEWCCEPNCQAESECPQCVPNDMGTMNRVCEVKQFGSQT